MRDKVTSVINYPVNMVDSSTLTNIYGVSKALKFKKQVLKRSNLSSENALNEAIN